MDNIFKLSNSHLYVSLRFVEGNEPLWKGYFYTGLIILATITTTIINNQYYTKLWLIGLRVRTALTSAIYRKSLRLSNAARKEMTGIHPSLSFLIHLDMQ